MIASIVFKPQNLSELEQFLEDNKENYPKIWVVITKKKVVNPQPLSFNHTLRQKSTRYVSRK